MTNYTGVVHPKGDREEVSKDTFRFPVTATKCGGKINGSSIRVARFFVPGGQMSDERPNPLEQIEHLRGNRKRDKERRAGLIIDYLAIENMIALGDSGSGGQHGRSVGDKAPAAHLIAVSQDIDAFAKFHARCLVDETAWMPRGIDTPRLLDGIASRIGHFTNGDDARLAWGFADELHDIAERAHNAANPDGSAWVDVGHQCTMPECAGRYRVKINRDNGATFGWRPQAVCFTVDENGLDHMHADHAVDGLLLAATADMVAA